PEEKKKNIIPKELIKDENQIASRVTKSEKTGKEETESKKPIVKGKNTNDVAPIKPDLTIKKPTIKEEIKEAKPGVENQTIAITSPVKNAPELLQNEKNQIAANETVATINQTGSQIQNTQARTVSYVPDASTDNQNYVFYDVATEEFRKSKVGGFIKKVRRIVERNNPITRIFNGEEEQMAAK